MLILSIAAKNKEEALAQLSLAQTKKIDAVELCLDYLGGYYSEVASVFLAASKFPVIFCLRPNNQGGFYPYSEKERFRCIENILKLKPDYFDLEFNVPLAKFLELKAISSQTKFIGSYHNFEFTPLNLGEILEDMIKLPIDIIKIAAYTQSVFDALRMLNLIAKHKGEIPLAGISMGKYGILSRILAPVICSALAYTYLPEQLKSAPGQLDVDRLTVDYRYHDLSPATKVCFMVGDLSSDLVKLCNKRLQMQNNDAICLALGLKADELANFFNMNFQLPAGCCLVEATPGGMSNFYVGTNDNNKVNIKHIKDDVLKLEENFAGIEVLRIVDNVLTS